MNGIGHRHSIVIVEDSRDERDALSRRDLWRRFFKVVVPPVALVLSVLDSIIAGIAAPTEAASMGALGAILVTGFAGRMSSTES